MSWVDFIVGDLCPSIGGFPTFCEDPDELLQLPGVRSALEKAGMTLAYWDGSVDTLCDWAHLPPTEKPLVIVERDYPRHVVESNLTNFMLESISVGEVFSKFHAEIVKLVPREHWDGLYLLQQTERPHRTPDETAILVARTFYGLDPMHLKFGDGWDSAIARLASSPTSIPTTIARAVISVSGAPDYVSPDDLVDVLCNPTTAQSFVHKLVRSNAAFAERFGAMLSMPAAKAADSRKQFYTAAAEKNWVKLWGTDDRTPLSVLQFAVEYGAEAAAGMVSQAQRVSLNSQFIAWLRSNYLYAMTSQSSQVLRLPSLLKRLSEEAGESPMLLVVVDALGIESWSAVREAWNGKIGLRAISERSAFALLPTLTTLSRRSLFEGKVPAQFGPGEHSQDAERCMWKETFGEDSGYFTPADTVKLDHAFSRRMRRIALVDVSWDTMGHAIFPQSDTITAAARRWAMATPIAGIIGEALSQKYRVFITSDHGQVPCTGTGRPNVGVLPEQRSKRAILFDNDALLNSNASSGIIDFQPYGLPQNLRVLFSEDLTSFDLIGVQSVSHGGPSIEEVIVPVVEVGRQ